MVEYKSTRDVETFSKFLENGGTLPEEPPAVSEVPPHQGNTAPSLCWAGSAPLGWGQGQAGGVCLSVPHHHCLLQVPQTPENSTGSEEPSSLGTAESRDEL